MTTAAVSPATSDLSLLLGDKATPRWLKEVYQFLPVNSQFLLYGNTRDLFPFRLSGQDASTELPAYDPRSLDQSIVAMLHMAGFTHFVQIDPIRGCKLLAPAAPEAEALAFLKNTMPQIRAVGADCGVAFEPEQGPRKYTSRPMSLDTAVQFAALLVQQRDLHCAVLFNYLMGRVESGKSSDRETQDAFVQGVIASLEAERTWEQGFFHPIFWICDRANELPAWLTLNNPRIRSIALAKPDALVRRAVAKSLASGGEVARKLPEKLDQDRWADELVMQTDGMTLNDLYSIMAFCKNQSASVESIRSAARRYKLGVTEDPWSRISRNDFKRIEDLIEKRIKGQQDARRHALAVLRRAILGLSGAHISTRSVKPKGVLFLAGPTGVGKTELAKSITEGIFGDEQAYIRFDMSEFNHEHADQRLTGAPPGYVGYEAGGELIDAIRQRPFSVLLFDEIDKAHPKILDKFLQILDDGQLTSGKGERVYFSDALIIFTSNIGVQDLTAETEYEDLRAKVLEAVGKHFLEIRRPELLNRIGKNNIVVFDFIRKDIAEQILRKMLENILQRVQETHRFELKMSGFPEPLPEGPSAYAELKKYTGEHLEHGGRGIGNELDRVLVNPLSDKLWEIIPLPGSKWLIESIRTEPEPSINLKELK
jgi:hypothetical protein